MNDFGAKLMSAGLFGVVLLLLCLIGMLIYTAISNQQRENTYMEKCIATGGIFIDGQGMDFCVKEFMPMEDK